MLTEKERSEIQSQLVKDRKAKNWIIGIGMASLNETAILTSITMHQESAPMFGLALASAGVLVTSIIRTEVLSSRIDRTRRILAEQHLPSNWRLIQ